MCFAGNALNNSFVLGVTSATSTTSATSAGEAGVATVVETSTEVVMETISTQEGNYQYTTLEETTQPSHQGMGLQTTTAVLSQPSTVSGLSDSTQNTGQPPIAITSSFLNTTNSTLYGTSGILSTSALCWNAGRQTAMPCSKSHSTGYFPGATTLASEGSYTEMLSAWWILGFVWVYLVR